MRLRDEQGKATRLVSGHSQVGLPRSPGGLIGTSPSDQHGNPRVPDKRAKDLQPSPIQQSPEEAAECVCKTKE